MCSHKYKEVQECQAPGLILQRKGCMTCYLPRRLGTDLVNISVTFVLSVWLRQQGSSPDSCQSKEFIFMGGITCNQSIEYIFMEDVACTLQSFKTVILSFIVHTGLSNYHQEILLQILVCLNMPRLNYSKSESVRPPSCLPQIVIPIAVEVKRPSWG